MSTGSLSGRVALVTGAGRGFGRAIAMAYLAAGADVVLHYRASKDGCAEVLDQAKALGRRAIAVRADLADADAGTDLVAAARAEFGFVDVLVNNAGTMRVGGFLASTEADWAAELDVNVWAPLRLTHAVAPMMVDRGYGKIVNLSSQLALRGWSRGAVYAATKGFLLTWTRSMAVELGPHGINVNAIGPGSIVTDMNHVVFPDAESIRRKAAELPLRRMGAPSDVADCAVFLAGSGSDFMTGQMLGVNGGSQM